MHLRTPALIWFIYFFTIALCSYAQPPVGNNYSISFLTTQDGLSQASNSFLLQDSKGYMWISSQDGINRYNGNEFFHFNEPKYFKNCPPFKQAFGIAEDAFGDIWIGSTRGLYRYSQSTNLFEKFDIFSHTEKHDITTMVYAVVDNKIWVTDGKNKFASIDCKTYKIKPLIEATGKYQINNFREFLPVVDSRKRTWVARNNSLYCFNPIDKTMQRFELNLSQLNEAVDFEISGLTLQEKEQVLGIATSKGLIIFNIAKQQQIVIGSIVKPFVNESIWYVKADNNDFLVSTDNHRLLRISVNGNAVRSLIDKKNLDNETHRGSTTNAIYIDKWDRIWLNATGEYIAISDFSPSFIKKITRAPVNGLPSGTLISIANTGNSIWVSDSYLTEIDRESGRVINIFSSEQLPGKPTAGIGQIFYDSLTKCIWLNAANKIYYYDLEAKKFTKLKYELEGSAYLSDIARCFVRLTSNELLFVTQKGIFNIEDNGATVNLIKDFTSDAAIYHLAELPGNRVAISYKSGPIKIFKKESGLNFSEIAAIPVDETNCMLFQNNGIIWAANTTGLYKIDATSYKTIKKFTVQDGLANDCINAALPDKFGWIWCSTNKGIVAVNTVNETVQNFGMSQNLQDLEFNARAFDGDSRGYIYFGGVKGLNYFKPPHLDNDSIQPRLILENISLNNNSYKDGINPDEINEIRYRYGVASLAIKVEALHLIKASRLKIKYRFNGLQNKWIEIGNGEQIQMFNLAAGKYTLEISYTNDGEVKNAPVRTLYLTVMPPWYNTWWFYCIAGCFVIAVIVLLLSYRQKQKLKQLKNENDIMKLNAAKDFIVQNERDRITADLHDDVGATLSSMYIYGDLAKNVWDTQPAESKKMIEKISTTSKDLMNRMGDIIWSMKPADEEKYSFKARLKNYSTELLSPKNILAEFEIDEELAAGINSPEVRKNILLIAKEAINNIAKYSEAAKATLSFKKQNEMIQLSISDDGKGFDATDIQKGNGLQNIQQRCKQLNGHIAINTAPGQGVSITCSFPIATISHS